VRRVVDRHHGRIGLRSQPGRGSTFTVDIPLQPPDAARDLPLVNGEIETGEAS
jgi:signal transduction histidine kinase